MRNKKNFLINNLLGIEDKDAKGGKVVLNVNNVKEFDNSDTSFFNENTLHYYGNGAPSETKADETAYVDTETFDVYYSNGTTWSKMGNIKSSVSD